MNKPAVIKSKRLFRFRLDFFSRLVSCPSPFPTRARGKKERKQAARKSSVDFRPRALGVGPDRYRKGTRPLKVGNKHAAIDRTKSVTGN